MIDKNKNNKLLVSGLHRTGHHAIMQWITSNVDLNTIFHPKIKKIQPSIHNNYENIITNKKHDIIVYDLENYSSAKKKLLKTFNINILIIRDPFNMISSIKKLNENNNKNKSIKWIKKHQFIIGNWISRYEFNINSINDFDLFILYNKWFSDIDYRKNIGKKLNLNSSCKYKINNITKDGCGSSFDGFNYSNSIDDMPVFDRYKYLSKDEIKLILDNKIIYDFSKKYFNDILIKIKNEYGF